MARSIFITATDTDAGKTWVTKHLIRQYLAVGIDAQALKPIASGLAESGVNIDVEILLAAQDKRLIEDINFHTFVHPVAPALSAEKEGFVVSLKALLEWQKIKELRASLTFVEGVGGLMTPLMISDNESYLVSDWLSSLPNIEVVLVAPLRLGCMSQILLTCKELVSIGKPPKWLVLNDLHDTKTFQETRNTLTPFLQRIFTQPPEIIGIEKNGNVSGLLNI